jgi:hypothetical protein
VVAGPYLETEANAEHGHAQFVNARVERRIVGGGRRPARHNNAGGIEPLNVSGGDLGGISHQAVDAKAVEDELDEMVKLAAQGKQQKDLMGLTESLLVFYLCESFWGDGGESGNHGLTIAKAQSGWWYGLMVLRGPIGNVYPSLPRRFLIHCFKNRLYYPACTIRTDINQRYLNRFTTADLVFCMRG